MVLADEVLVLKQGLKVTSPLPFYFESLNYPASGPENYLGSVMAGRTTLINEINWITATFPNTAIVLAGHSQGAAVVLAALTNVNTPGYPELTANARARIKAAAVFGDPNYRVGQAIAAPGAQTTASGLMGARIPAYSAQLNNLRFWGWPMGGNAEGWVQKIRSWCYAKDTFCASGTASNSMAINNSYGVNAMTGAKQWIEYMFNAF
jgi:hypothetical protein